jgi:hypothetical protein
MDHRDANGIRNREGATGTGKEQRIPGRQATLNFFSLSPFSFVRSNDHDPPCGVWQKIGVGCWAEMRR